MKGDQLGFPFLPKLQSGLTVTETALEIPEKLTFEQWEEIGEGLGKIQQATQWWIGDWWNCEKFAQGDRTRIVSDPDWMGPAYDTCNHAAITCRAFEFVRRRTNLTFTHHVEVSSLPSQKADELLNWCEEPLKDGADHPRTVSELREKMKKAKLKAATRAQRWNDSQYERKAALERGETVLANMSSDENGIPIDNALISWAEGEGLAIRIDRQSDWGNPYEVDADGTREEVIEWYAEYFAHKRSLHKKRNDLAGKLLLCWCYPEPCHGNFLIEQLDAD